MYCVSCLSTDYTEIISNLSTVLHTSPTIQQAISRVSVWQTPIATGTVSSVMSSQSTAISTFSLLHTPLHTLNINTTVTKSGQGLSRQTLIGDIIFRTVSYRVCTLIIAHMCTVKVGPAVSGNVHVLFLSLQLEFQQPPLVHY